MARKFEYRTPPGAGAYLVLADDSDVNNGAAQISGYQPPTFRWSPQTEGLYQSLAPLAQNQGNGLINFGFKVLRTYANLGAAALALIQQSQIFNVMTNFDFKITDAGQVYYVLDTAPVEFAPDPDPDLSTFIKYAFQGGRYNTSGA